VSLNECRRILTELYNGDYAHAGGAEAIDIVLTKVLQFNPRIKQQKALDIGSGFGGTAYCLYQQGFKQVYGFDIDPVAVSYAKYRYPMISFTIEDALKAHRAFPDEKFGFVYLFNVAYAIADKKSLLSSITRVVSKGTMLVLFDYAQRSKQDLGLFDLSNRPMFPINVSDMTQKLLEHGWKALLIEDTTIQCISWYEELLGNLEKQYDMLQSKFSQESVVKVRQMFESLLGRVIN
jgi:SAM-dependent methyltransferase